MKKFISNLITATIVTALLWMGTSTIEVISKNLEPNPQYSEYNFYCVLTDITE